MVIDFIRCGQGSGDGRMVGYAGPMPLVLAAIAAILLLSSAALADENDPPTTVLLGNRLVAELPLPADCDDIKKAAVIDFASKQLSWLYGWAVDDLKPDRIVVIGGQEDFLLNIPPETVAANFLQIAEDLKQRGVEPILTTVLPLPPGSPQNDAIAACNERLRASCEERDIRLVDFAAYLSQEDALHSAFVARGNYLNWSGYAVLADAVLTSIEDSPIGELRAFGPIPPNEPVDPFNLPTLARARIDRILADSPGGVKLVMLGDSITEAGGDWNERLGTAGIRNSGQGGYATGQMLWLLDDAVLDAEPQRVLLMGGINDLSIGVEPEQLYANVETIVARLQAAGVEPVLQSTLYQRQNPGTYDTITAHNQRLQALAAREGLTYLDLNAVLSDADGLKAEYTTDNTHLTDAGYAAWASVLREYLAQHPINGQLLQGLTPLPPPLAAAGGRLPVGAAVEELCAL